MSLLSPAELTHLIQSGVPLFADQGIKVTDANNGAVTLSLPFREDMIRPGGTISGPTLFGLADAALYAAVLSTIGPVELAVTTNVTINFLRKPDQAELFADARILKPGKRLIMGEVGIRSSARPAQDLVAHATGTYSVPPR